MERLGNATQRGAGIAFAPTTRQDGGALMGAYVRSELNLLDGPPVPKWGMREWLMLTDYQKSLIAGSFPTPDAKVTT